MKSNSEILDTSVQYIKTVGPKRAEAFEKANLKTIRDLLFYFPSRYLDRSTLLTSGKAYNVIEKGYEGELTIIGKVVDKERKHFGKKDILKITLRDSDGFFECVWFQGAKYFVDRFQESDTFAISGKPTISKFGQLTFAHPDFDKISDDESQVFYSTGKIIPFYRIPKELKNYNIGDLSFRKIISYAIDSYVDYVEESLPARLIKKNNLSALSVTVKNLHQPESFLQIAEAKKRLKYEELFYIEVLVASRKNNYKTKLTGNSFSIKTELVTSFIKNLSFELTSAQKKVLKEILSDMKLSQPMNRLLQGDVGSGKTIVALIAMLVVVDCGYQAALMAPTEILADQHARNISKLISAFSKNYFSKEIKISLIVGGQAKSKREKELEEVGLQQSDIIVGTHALFEERVHFNKLGLIVVDEQHRFGVVQRAKLIGKGITPDVLIMSATPIPRTLTMTLYGDLDVSVINEMPKNRIPIKTYLRGESKLHDIYNYIITKHAEGNKAFIVYPLVEESEKLELKAAESYYNELTKTFFKDLNVGLIHGRMKWREKEDVMLLFAAGKYDVLISTTVIEVGIDVPDANIIVINDAHRFGLSQLHQLRGRVGRGNKQAYCILVTKDEWVASSNRLNEKLEFLSTAQLEKFKSSVRLQTMVKYLDGFKIAEVDMKLRGPGDIFGIKQSGFPELKYSDITSDVEILVNAKQDAFELVEKDQHIMYDENAVVRKNLLEHYSSKLNYAKIG